MVRTALSYTIESSWQEGAYFLIPSNADNDDKALIDTSKLATTNSSLTSVFFAYL